MKKIIIDYSKLNDYLLNLLVEKFPDGYGYDDIITFTNHKGEKIEAVEIKTKDAIYLVKISSRLEKTMEKFNELENDDENENDDDTLLNEDIDDTDLDDDF